MKPTFFIPWIELKELVLKIWLLNSPRICKLMLHDKQSKIHWKNWDLEDVYPGYEYWQFH